MNLPLDLNYLKSIIDRVNLIHDPKQISVGSNGKFFATDGYDRRWTLEESEYEGLFAYKLQDPTERVKVKVGKLPKGPTTRKHYDWPKNETGFCAICGDTKLSSVSGVCLRHHPNLYQRVHTRKESPKDAIKNMAEIFKRKSEQDKHVCPKCNCVGRIVKGVCYGCYARDRERRIRDELKNAK